LCSLSRPRQVSRRLITYPVYINASAHRWDTRHSAPTSRSVAWMLRRAQFGPRRQVQGVFVSLCLGLEIPVFWRPRRLKLRLVAFRRNIRVGISVEWSWRQCRQGQGDLQVASPILHPPWGACRTLSSFASPTICTTYGHGAWVHGRGLQVSVHFDDILASCLSLEGVLSSSHERGKSTLKQAAQRAPLRPDRDSEQRVSGIGLGPGTYVHSIRRPTCTCAR
jgi:hypothetical protein